MAQVLSPTPDALTVAQAAQIMRDPLLWAKVAEHPNGCWVWTAAVTSCGYGRLTRERRVYMAHRWIYTGLVDAIPEGLTLDHLCRTPACVNPAHLEPVTLRENILRGNGVGVRNAAKTHCARGHEFTAENTYRKTGGKRGCRECGRQATRRWRERTA